MSQKSRDVRDYLHGVTRMERAINRNRSEIKRLYDRIHEQKRSIESLSGVSYDGVRVQTSHENHTEDRIIKLIDAEAQIEERIAYLEVQITNMDKERILILDQINGLGGDPDFSEILYQHYVKRKDLYEIADDIPMSYSGVCHKHGAALMLFQSRYRV